MWKHVATEQRRKAAEPVALAYTLCCR